MKIIKLSLFVFAANLFCTSSYANDAQDIFYQAFNLAKKESPFSQQINWDSIEKEALQFIGDEAIACRGTSAIDNILAPALRKFDFHTLVTVDGLGSVMCPIRQSEEMSSYWQDWIGLNEDKRTLLKENVNHFWGQRFNDIAYIYVPGGFAYNNDDLEARIREGRGVIDSLNLETAKGIIVDFRLNWGGHYFPMLMSIAKIINPTILFQYTNGEHIKLSEEGNTLTSFTSDGENETLYQIDSLPPVSRVSLPIVILVDESTASSGAITAFALKENSSGNQLVGERTSSSLSVNTSLKLNDGNYFNLMILRLLSPNGIEQPLFLDVDYHVAHDFYSMFSANDQSVKFAMNLLNGSVS